MAAWRGFDGFQGARHAARMALPDQDQQVARRAAADGRGDRRLARDPQEIPVPELIGTGRYPVA